MRTVPPATDARAGALGTAHGGARRHPVSAPHPAHRAGRRTRPAAAGVAAVHSRRRPSTRGSFRMIAPDPLWTRVYHPSPGAALRLVCLPHAGGSAAFFFSFSVGLAPEAEVTAIQYPGHQDRRHEPCVDSLARPIKSSRRWDRWTPGRSRCSATAWGRPSGSSWPGCWRGPAGRWPGCSLPDAARPRETGRGAPAFLDDDQLLADVRALDGTDQRLLDDDLIRLALRRSGLITGQRRRTSIDRGRRSAARSACWSAPRIRR